MMQILMCNNNDNDDKKIMLSKKIFLITFRITAGIFFEKLLKNRKN